MRQSPRIFSSVVICLSLAGCRLVSNEALDALFGTLDPAVPPDTGIATTDTDTEAGTGDSDPSVDDSAEPVDRDGDGVSEDADCDDNDPSRYPGAVELLDEVDNDCDGALATATVLDLPAEPGSVGPVELFVRTDGGTPLVVLAWTSERCTDETSDSLACLGRRFWNPGADDAESAFEPQTVSKTVLGPSSNGTVLDFAYGEQGVIQFVRAVRTDAVTAVSQSALAGDVVTTIPFPTTYSGEDEHPTRLSAVEAISVDLQILDTIVSPLALSVACADGRLVDMQQDYYGDYHTRADDWTLGERRVRVDGCAIGASLEGSNHLQFAVGLHFIEEEESEANTQHSVSQHTLSSAPSYNPFKTVPGTIRHMDSSRIHMVDPYAIKHWGVNALAHAGGLLLRRQIETETEIVNPVLMDFTVSSETSDAVGIQHIGVDVINDNLAPAWVCLVDDDGKAYIGRAEHSADGGEHRFSQFPVSLAEPATSCAIAAFEGTHIVAAFDTASGPHVVEAPLPDDSDAGDADAPAD